MDRYELLAAEIYGYSYANYRDHLGIGNVRYDSLMPEVARTLERAEAEGWPAERVARELHVDPAEAAKLLQSFRRARDVVPSAGVDMTIRSWKMMPRIQSGDDRWWNLPPRSRTASP